MFSGLLDLPWWGYVLVTLGMTHITIVSITIYLHRHQAHRALELHPALAHFFRFWLWLASGTVTEEWVAVHRKHHACVESEDDPHSPKVFGIKKLLLEGAELYRQAAYDREAVAKYNHGCPDDWLERNVYKPYTDRGYYLMLIIDVVLFGPIGITIWAVQMAWQPIFAAGVINGMGHWWGYRNYETQDISTNIVPWGILIGGEELHNNHHAFASSAKMSTKPWEFDIGWAYIRMLEFFRLAKVKKLPPEVVMVPGKLDPDIDTVQAVISNRFQVMADYAKRVLSRVYAEEIARIEFEPAWISEVGAVAADARGVDAEQGGEAASGACPRPQRRTRDRLPIQTPAPGGVAATPCDPRAPGGGVARVVPAGGRERSAGARGVRPDASHVLDASGRRAAA